MRELGEYLRQMRESRGVSLEEVARATRVNIRYLRALEEGQYDVLPPEVYVRGFLRAYGEYLGIDPEELYARYEASKPKKRGGFFARRETRTPSPTTTPSELTSAPQTKPQFNIAHLIDALRAIPAVIYAFAGLIILVGVILIISLGGEKSPPPENVAEAILGDTTLQRVAAAPEDEDMSQIIKISIDSVNAAQAIGKAESLTFVVRAKARVSVYAEADYQKKLFRGTLYRGQRKKWRVKNTLYLEASNPAALEISVNGFDLKPLNIRGYGKFTIGRENLLTYLAEGYVPPPPGVGSAYGQRIESPSADTVPGPPSEKAAPPNNLRQRRNINQINLPPLAPKPATSESAQKNTGKPRIKPPQQLKPPASTGGEQ